MTDDDADDARIRKADYQRAWRASKGARTGRRGPPVTRPHGTVAAYTRHRRRGEPPCEPCRQAWAEQQRKLYRKRRGNADP